MCACGEIDLSFVCTRCEGTREDWRISFDPEPETPEERTYRLTNEHVALVVEPVLRAA